MLITINSMLLVITGSHDGSADLLFSRGLNAFRLNFDLFSEYQFEISPLGWKITDPVGRTVSSETATRCWWWKTFNFGTDLDPYISEEVKYCFRELYSWFSTHGVIKGNSPDFHRHFGKMKILSIASEFFAIPETKACWGFPVGADLLLAKDVVAKSLASGLITTTKALFTTEVDQHRLAPTFPWYLQEKITAEEDVTVFVCGNKIFPFARSRAGMKGLDCRNQGFQFGESDGWLPTNFSVKEIGATNSFNAALNIEWGRMDFLRSNGELVFLEYNANGQWAFLDEQDEVGLVQHVFEYLSK